MSEEKKPVPVKKTRIIRNLTISQKAEAAALWRSGSVTLEDLGKKFKKRPDSMWKILSKMGIEKGSAVEESVKAVLAAAEERAITDVEVTLKKIAETKEQHYKYSRGLASLAWSEILRARQAGVDIASLKDLMATLKLASDVFAGTRKELFSVLNVDKFDQEADLDTLPELTVRELTTGEMKQLQTQPGEDELNDLEDSGALMLPEDVVEGM